MSIPPIQPNGTSHDHASRRSIARRIGLALAVGGAALLGTAVVTGANGKPGQAQVPTTLEDFFQPGSQPEPDSKIFVPVVSASSNCTFCHAEYLEEIGRDDEPWDGWVATMMAQSARDPVWHAALTIANQDAADAGEYCIRCHAPGAWLSGRSLPSDTSGFIEEFVVNDFDGVNCHFCHRNVNPVLEADSPKEDADILAALLDPPGADRGNGRYVVDPSDVRRGPYLDIAENPDMNPHGKPVLYSPYHRRSEMCSTCHDVGNPIFSKQPDGSYALNAMGEEHPTQDPYDMFPEQRTYSEWANSQFANGGVAFLDGRFGGAHPTGVMEECQDCHMPDQVAGGCSLWESKPWFERQDLPQHTFAGANTWVLSAVHALYPETSGLSLDRVDAAEERNRNMLRAASDVEVAQLGDQLKVRVVNYSGHKLPTGYPEGRRMWVNVRYFDEADVQIDERGAYDFTTALLTSSDTKVYESILGITEEVAAFTGLPEGPSAHLALNGERVLDNRIPPIGFTNAAFESFDAAPVAYFYEDGQYWDDTLYDIPPAAARAVVTLYYQSMTREYIEELRDLNVTNDRGTVIYDLWADPTVGDKAPPVDMDMVLIDFTPLVAGDVTGDGFANFADILAILSMWGDCPPPTICPEDLNCDGTVSFEDLLVVLSNWS